MNCSHEWVNLQWEMHQILALTLDAVVMMVGLVGHSLVIYILTSRRRKNGFQSVRGTDTLLLALSASDLLLLTCLPFHTAAIAMGYWPFSSFMCKAISFLGVASSSASVFMLAALAVTRYLIVVHPTWTYRSRMQRWLKVCVILMWVPAISLAAPQFAFRTVRTPVIHCFAFLSNLSQLVYSSTLFLFGFALPLIIIIVMYAKIYSFLRWTRGLQGGASQLERYQNQVTQTSALLVLVFTICWLPSYVLMFLLIGSSMGRTQDHRYFAIFARLLASSSVVTNPLLYAFMSHKFRQELLVLVQMLCRSRRSVICPGGATVQPFNPMELDTPPQPCR